VCGLDSEPVEGEMQERDMLLRHIDSINAISIHYRNAPKIFIPEVNYSMRDHLPNMLIGQPNVFIFKDKKGRIGVWKSEQTAGEYRWFTSNALYHRSIRFDDNMFTNSHIGEDWASVDQIKHVLQNQLEGYHYVAKRAQNPFQSDKVKLHGKSGGKNDDLIMVFMMALTWGKLAVDDPRLRQASNRN